MITTLHDTNKNPESPLELVRLMNSVSHGQVAVERLRQISKWGEQNHPDFREGYYFVPSAEAAKQQCDTRFAVGDPNWGDILLEEVAEAFEERNNEENLRTELVQIAAVALSWVDAIDRRRAKRVIDSLGVNAA